MARSSVTSSAKFRWPRHDQGWREGGHGGARPPSLHRTAATRSRHREPLPVHGSHELCMLFGEAKDVIYQIERVYILGGSAAENGEKRWVCVQEGAIRRHARYPVDRMFHEVAVPRLG